MNLELATGKDLASVDEHWMMFAKFTLNVLQRFLVSRMNRLVSQEGSWVEKSLAILTVPFPEFHSEEDKIALLPAHGQILEGESRRFVELDEGGTEDAVLQKEGVLE